MTYQFKAHPTKYHGVMFRSRLEARWACFFDRLYLQWEYEPIDLKGWTPDFCLHLRCLRRGCNDDHVLLVEVKPYHRIEQFDGHPCMDYFYGSNGVDVLPLDAEASAAFGINPHVTYWEMCHGNDGGSYTLADWMVDYGDVHVSWFNELWKEAGNTVQWKPR